MRLSLWTLLASSALTLSGTTAAVRNPNSFRPEDIIDRDVVILGGGATGTYAAVQLRRRGHSVALVEQTSRLGGHASTVYLPNGGYVNYGVEGYFNHDITKEFFALLDVDYEPLLPGSWLTKHIDFRTGKRVWPSSDIATTAVSAVLYRAAIEQFDYLAMGAYYFPDKVPEVLLRPFREFVAKHNLQRAVQLIFMFSQNVGNILDTPLLYVIMNFGIPQIHALLEGGYIKPKNGTDVLFNKAAIYIDEANNILYDSTAVQVTRDSAGVQAIVKNAKTGSQKLIRAKKLLVAHPPTLPKLQGFDLRAEETSLFAKWTYKTYYAAAVRSPSLPEGFNLLNTYPENRPGGTPTTPFQWQLEYSGVPGYYMSKMVGETNFTEAEARQLVIDDIKRMSSAGTFEMEAGEEPELVAFISHSPETMMVHVDEVREGFYKKLYGLQGLHSTYYTGYTFCTDYSTVLWNYTASVIDMMGL
ncbi:FAD/NAD(P)-binding domain-containing protein [Parathielavia hyrcaniae]|uniref:FAD/NAD(P)-binding domain-containing protein n=1 Tax=Parathielavia hyrcaniae TaxID=113614 RepID=A0AAN6SY36_9PEZI|nr:FAD/NAD(P)-binding domain-containing protein [Parathielavia hyrcaniae]